MAVVEGVVSSTGECYHCWRMLEGVVVSSGGCCMSPGECYQCWCRNIHSLRIFLQEDLHYKS